MFTGIIETTAKVLKADLSGDLLHVTINLPAEQSTGLQTGASISVNGVCLTVTNFTNTQVQFDVMQESLRVTSLANVQVGDLVNIERSMKPGDEVGGHIMSGHVDGLAEVTECTTGEGSAMLKFVLAEPLRKYVFSKGFIGVHGCSLTACDVNQTTGEFTVWLIPETLKRTNLGSVQVGDMVNIEVHRETQVIVDTVERVVREMLPQSENVKMWK